MANEMIRETLDKIATAPAGERITCPWEKSYFWTVDGRVGAFVALNTGKLAVRGVPGKMSWYLGRCNAFRKVHSTLVTFLIAYTVLFVNYRFLSGVVHNGYGGMHMFLMDTVFSNPTLNNWFGLVSTVVLAAWLAPKAYFFASLGMGAEMVMPSGKWNGMGLVSISGLAGALGFAFGYGIRIFGA
jgi:hypothetical protein